MTYRTLARLVFALLALPLAACDAEPLGATKDPDASPAPAQARPAGEERTVHGDTVEVAPGEEGSAGAACDEGERLVAGGCSSAEGEGDLSLYESRPTLAPEGWRCGARAGAAPAHLVVTLVCEPAP